MAYQAGQLDQRISLQRKSRVRDGAGGATETWTEYAEVYAMVRPMTGRERQNAERAEALSDYVVVIRYRSGILPSDRIEWRGRKLNIRFIRNQGPRTSWLEIEAEMGASN